MMSPSCRATLNAAALAAALVPLPARGAAAEGEAPQFLLIRRDHRVQQGELAEIDERSLVIGNRDRGWSTVDLAECVALVQEEVRPGRPHEGVLWLADGQRFPGEALSGSRAAAGVFVWNHSTWLGRLEVPLDRIASVVLVPGATLPAPARGDVLALANGDRIEGFVESLGDPVSIRVGEGAAAQLLEVPLDRVTALRVVTPRGKPSGRRLWLRDGTVVDVVSVSVADDGVMRLNGLPFMGDSQPKQLNLSALVAILFEHRTLVPFTHLELLDRSAPPSRYSVPEPEALDESAPLGLSRVALRGPLSVRYRLPAAPVFFTAEARLPESARAWADCDLVVRDDDTEVLRVHLDAAHPVAAVDVALSGATLQLQITEGRNGPIQDTVILHRAMLLVE